jgi:putative PIN family toxin of toxin-antitoxin system
VAVAWLVFDDPAIAGMVESIESGAWRVFTSAECFSELQRVLAYRNLKLDANRQAAALERYIRHVVVFEDFEAAPSGLPLCTDPDDQKFLELAWHSRADRLVTKDNALLEMASRVARLGRFEITPP